MHGMRNFKIHKNRDEESLRCICFPDSQSPNAECSVLLPSPNTTNQVSWIL